MHCFYVMVHGTFKWDTPTVSPDQASTTEAAQAKAFARVRLALSKDDWLNPHSVVLHLAADEITTAPFYKFLLPENRGHSFYTEE
jgi:hypothetical protein